jgi:hypothetical protein
LLSCNSDYCLDTACVAVIVVVMHIETVPNRKSRPTILLREGWREGKHVRKRTLANLTHWPPQQIESLRRVLQGQTLVSVEEVFKVERSLPHGHVELVLEMVRRLGLEKMISSRRSRQRDLVVGMLVEQLIDPCSKLATTRMWHTTTLAEELSVGEADEDALYEVLDWLLERQQQLLRGAHLLVGAIRARSRQEEGQADCCLRGDDGCGRSPDCCGGVSR